MVLITARSRAGRFREIISPSPPGLITAGDAHIRHPQVTHFCLLSWDPAVRSGGAVTMQYVGPAPPP
jgi:hypothetical protein